MKKIFRVSIFLVIILFLGLASSRVVSFSPIEIDPLNEQTPDIMNRQYQEKEISNERELDNRKFQKQLNELVEIMPEKSHKRINEVVESLPIDTQEKIEEMINTPPVDIKEQVGEIIVNLPLRAELETIKIIEELPAESQAKIEDIIDALPKGYREKIEKKKENPMIDVKEKIEEMVEKMPYGDQDKIDEIIETLPLIYQEEGGEMTEEVVVETKRQIREMKRGLPPEVQNKIDEIIDTISPDIQQFPGLEPEDREEWKAITQEIELIAEENREILPEEIKLEVKNILQRVSITESDFKEIVSFEDPRETGIIIEDIFKVTEIVAGETFVREDGTEDIENLIIRGTGPPESLVVIFLFSTPIRVSTMTDSYGNWSYLLEKELADGSHEVFVASVDNTGNILARSNPAPFVKEAAAIEVNFIPLPGAQIGAFGFFDKKMISVLIAALLIIIVVTIILLGITINKTKKKQDV